MSENGERKDDNMNDRIDSFKLIHLVNIQSSRKITSNL